MPIIYTDLDGVLADLESGVQELFHAPRIPLDTIAEIVGRGVFWDKVHLSGVFARMPEMPGARQFITALTAVVKPGVWDSVQVLTASPSTRPETAESKRHWVTRRWSNLRVLTCETRAKPSFCVPGDILIDDRVTCRAGWIAAGGHFIHHVDFQSTLEAVAAYTHAKAPT